MHINTRINQTELEIYRGKWGARLFALLLAGICIGFGLFFSQQFHDNLIATFIGYCFIIAGALILMGFPRYVRLTQNGAVLLRANREGITLAPILNIEPVFYRWESIQKIALVQRLHTRHGKEHSYSWNKLLVYLTRDVCREVGLLESSRKQLYLSAEKYCVTAVNYCRSDMQNIIESLARLSGGRIEITGYSRLDSDFDAGRETFQP